MLNNIIEKYVKRFLTLLLLNIMANMCIFIFIGVESYYNKIVVPNKYGHHSTKSEKNVLFKKKKICMYLYMCVYVNFFSRVNDDHIYGIIKRPVFNKIRRQ